MYTYNMYVYRMQVSKKSLNLILIEKRYTGISEAFFKIKLNCFLDTLILKISFWIIKTNNFQGDLNDISAKTATLTGMQLRPLRQPWQ